jgi:hypothetical protein
MTASKTRWSAIQTLLINEEVVTMYLRHIFTALAITSAVFHPAMAAPTKKATGAQLLSRASLSFSKVPFDTLRKEVKIPLKIIKNKSCLEVNVCQYSDANKIEYNFWDEDEYLVDKSLSASDFKGKTIGALGIGMAREKAEVLKKASAFLGGTKYSCTKEADRNEAGEKTGEILTRCDWMLGEGWTFVQFNSKGQLIMMQVTSSQYT